MTEKHHREECKCDQCQPNLDRESYSAWHDLEGNPVTKPSPSPAQAAADEICAYMLADDFNTEHYQPGWQNIAPIIAKHYAALTEQLAAVTAERDENIMSCEITYDEWKRMQKRAEAAEAESGLLTRSLERAMNWKDAAEARVAELETKHGGF